MQLTKNREFNHKTTMSKPFTLEEQQTLLNLWPHYPIRVISHKMNKSESALYRAYLSVLKKSNRKSRSKNEVFNYLFTFINSKFQELNIIVCSSISWNTGSFYRPAAGIDQDKKLEYAVCKLSDFEFNALTLDVPKIHLNTEELPQQAWEIIDEYMHRHGYRP